MSILVDTKNMVINLNKKREWGIVKQNKFKGDQRLLNEYELVKLKVYWD